MNLYIRIDEHNDLSRRLLRSPISRERGTARMVVDPYQTVCAMKVGSVERRGARIIDDDQLP